MTLIETLGIRTAGPAACVALHEYVSNRSVALVLKHPNGSDPNIASGVCLRIGERYLVATAAHVIKDLDPANLIVLGRGERYGEPLKMLRMGPADSVDAEDVSWLEIDPVGSRPAKLKFVTLDQIESFNETASQQPCLVQGYPYSAIDQMPDGRPLVESDGLLSLTIPPNLRASEHKAHIDIAFQYPPHDGSLSQAGLHEPFGISGGGLWLVPRFDANSIWSAEAAKLIGIQRAWWRAEKEAVATRIECWLSAVERDIPDLKTEVERAHQRLAQSSGLK